MTTSPSTPPEPGASLTFGLVPFTDSDAVREVLDAFCALLGRLAGASIAAHRASSPTALAAAVRSGRVDVAWMSPSLLVLLSEGPGELWPLASSVRGGVEAYHAALFVAEASTIQSPAQLAGTRAAWVDPTSAAGYIFPRIALARRGLDPRTLFASEAFYDSHLAVARAVLEGEADVGATFAAFEGGDPSRGLERAGFRGVVEGADGRVIDASGPIPSDVIVATEAVPAPLRAALSTALCRLEAEPEARRALDWLFGVQGFRAFSPDAFRALRETLAAGRASGLVP